jgi:FtsZ-binding cell division protein ZapB
MLGDMPDALQIPNDLAACQALIRQQTRQLDAQVHTIESHSLTIEELQRQKQALEQEKQELQLAFAELL